jgi:hypothetical protein
MSSENIATLLKFPFKAQRWGMKIAIGSLLILASTVVPLVPLFFVAGYSLRIIQRIIHGDGQPVMPDWDDWEWLFKHGFKLSEAGLFYALPGLVLFTAGYIMVFFPILGMSLARLASSVQQPLSADATALMNHGAIVLGVASLLTLVGAFISVPAAMHMAAKDDVKAIFRIKEWWAILRQASGKFICGFTWITIASILLMILVTVMTATLVLCLPATLLFSVAVMYLCPVASALFAKAYRTGVEKLAASENGVIQKVKSTSSKILSDRVAKPQRKPRKPSVKS